MRAAGIRQYSGPVEPLDLPGPGEPRPDEVLIEVRSGRGGIISVEAGATFPLDHAADALTCLRHGTNGQAVVLRPDSTG